MSILDVVLLHAIELRENIPVVSWAFDGVQLPILTPFALLHESVTEMRIEMT